MKVYFLQFWRLKQHGWVLVRSVFWPVDSQFLTVSSWRRKRRNQLFRVPFIRALIPFMRAPVLWPNDLPKIPLANTVTLQVRTCIMERGHKTLAP